MRYLLLACFIAASAAGADAMDRLWLTDGSLITGTWNAETQILTTDQGPRPIARERILRIEQIEVAAIPKPPMADTALSDGRLLTGITDATLSPSGGSIGVVAASGSGVYPRQLFAAAFLDSWHIIIPPVTTPADDPPDPAQAQSAPAQPVARDRTAEATAAERARLTRLAKVLQQQIEQRNLNLGTWIARNPPPDPTPPRIWPPPRITVAPSPMNNGGKAIRGQMIAEYRAETEALKARLTKIQATLDGLPKETRPPTPENTPIGAPQPVRRLGRPTGGQ